MGKNGALAKLPDQMTYIFDAAKNDIVADFTSEGPTDVDFRVKPDVMAPGVNVLSSIPVRFCGGAPCFAFFQGTSMATPHLAGSAAVLRWAISDMGRRRNPLGGRQHGRAGRREESRIRRS